MPEVDATPTHLKPFAFHGLILPSRGGRDAYADCPFCGREGKLGVNTETTQWRCYACDVGGDNGKDFRGGNSLTFVRLLWEWSLKATAASAYRELQADRKLASPKTLAAWGVARSITTGEWIVPQFAPDGRMHQLCRRVRISKVKDGKRTFVDQLLPTPGLHPSGESLGLLMPVGGFDSAKPDVMVTEGCWDGMALWEALKANKVEDGSDELKGTSNEAISLAATVNVVSVPGAGVWREPWTRMVAGKNVCLMYDNDHPRESSSPGAFTQAGMDGMRKVSGILLSSAEPMPTLSYLRWGSEGDGWSKEAKDGYDVRDCITGGGLDALNRRVGLKAIQAMLRPIPDAWRADVGSPGEKGSGKSMRSLACSDWGELVKAWRKALTWRQGLEDVLAVMLAVALSTEQLGDQLFLQVIGAPSSAKTQFCDGMLVSRRCHALEHLTGFHSGWKGKKEDKDGKGNVVDNTGKDFSLLARINRKTLITAEGDVVMSSPNAVELMSQQRRIFDGKSGATYKNSDEDRQYEGLRTPWIMAGTPALLDNDQARLGDRFLRVMMDNPDAEMRRDIMRRVGFTALRSVLVTSNCDPRSQKDSVFAKAYRMTGGYVDFLRDDPAKLLRRVKIEDEDAVIDRLGDLAEFAADLRARPNLDTRKDIEAVKELPFRLQHQFVRLAACLAVVTGRWAVDDEVLRIVRKVAVDTSHGWSLKVVRILQPFGEVGESLPRIAAKIGLTEDRARSWLKFLTKLDVTEPHEVKQTVTGVYRVKWRLTNRMAALCESVLGVPSANDFMEINLSTEEE